MWKISSVVLVLMCFTLASNAQEANSWINYNQEYYKIKVAENGLYRVSAQELIAAGVPVNSIPRGRYQLFRRGQEVAINVYDSDNDQLIEYLEFYGKKNDGKMDTELYVSEAAQPHAYYSLFTDSAAYFLTWKLTSGSTGKRMQASNDRTSGLSPAPYHLQDSLVLQVSRYSTGPLYGPGNEIKSATYDYGEGWTGNAFGKNQSQTFNLDLKEAVRNGPDPQLQILLTGGNNLEHLVDISVGPNQNNLRSVGQAAFERQFNYLFASELKWTDVSNEGALVVKVTALGHEGQSERVSVSYVKCEFPAEVSFSSDKNQQIYRLEQKQDQRSLMVVQTTEASSLRVLDVTEPKTPIRLASTAYTDRLESVYTTFGDSRELLVVRNAKNAGSIRHVEMNELNPPSANYLIISHSKLNQEVDGVRPVSAYGAYRASAAGGNYNVVIADIDNIYDQFSYGDPSPLAIKNYLKFSASVSDPEYLFLIGKGTSVDFAYFRKDPASTNLVHYIPTFGHPGSDLLFSVGINDDKLHALPTGRLNAFEAKDVKAYLDKVKEMESLPYDNLWRKNLVQLSGGKTTSERSIFANYIRQFADMAEGHFWGGKATNIYKENNNPVQVINIASEVNNGVSLVTFFGHSASAGTDLEIGKVSNPDQGYSNHGKYPVFLVNGCNAGEIFGSNVTTQQISFGEDWIKTPGKGALAFIANSDFALSSNLKRFSDLFYQVAFKEEATFGNSVGKILHEASRRYLGTSTSSETHLSQIHQTVLQGDPAVVIFGAQKPDFHVTSENLYASSFEGKNILAGTDSFKINLIVKNFGRTVRDSLKVQVERTLSDGKVVTYQQSFVSVMRHDTLHFKMYNFSENVNEGDNNFLITIDPENQVDELQENNNTATFSLFLNKGSTINLYPTAYATVNDAQVELVWQPSDLLAQNRDYIVEMDTLPSFSSPMKSAITRSGRSLLSASYDLSVLPDSTTVYWRTRYAEANAQEDTSWVNSSFTYASGIAPGWGHFEGYQMLENNFLNVEYDPDRERLSFRETRSEVKLATHGPESGLTYEDYQVLIEGVDFLTTDNALDPECKKKNSINAIFFDRESALPYRPFGLTPNDVLNDLVCGRTPQMIHNMSQVEVLQNETRYLDSLIGRMKERDKVLLFSFGEVAYSEWDERIKTSLRSVGVETSVLESIADGQPVIFLGRKGDQPGSAKIVVNQANPVKAQVIQLLDEVTGQFSSGGIITTSIGPAKKWGKFRYTIEPDEQDDYSFEVYGITSNGNVQSVFSGSRISEIDLSQVDARQYPFLKIDLNFSDVQNQTPPQLKNWTVSYDLPPEGLLMIPEVSANLLQEGEEFVRSFNFSTLSSIPFADSLTVNYTVTNIASGVREVNAFQIQAPDPDTPISFNTPVKTRGKTGKNNLSVKVEAGEQELYLQNNSVLIAEAFTVEADQTNPVLDVTFDGGYILDGDIVSPTPNILIRFKDDNQYLYKDDTSGIQIDLKRPCDLCDFERVKFTSPDVSYTPASEDQDFEINYSPGPLENGLYRLRVDGTDESGNASGAYPYEITFEVINESTITHFYPYPNPFSTSTRFVFTLTGSVIPADLKIQIMTVTGRVVREITQDEIGPLRIGNNITQYAWDGRDEYGDQLANGVYLYKVFIQEDGTDIQHRNTSADRGFKHGFGKLYILR